MNPIQHLDEHRLRRERLMAAIGSDAAAIVVANRELPRNHDVDYQFRQDSDFYYLTGFLEPETVLVLTPGSSEGDSTLFVRPRDERLEQWNGRRLGKDRVRERLGIDRGFNLEDLDEEILDLLKDRQVVHFSFGLRPEYDTRFFEWLVAMRGRRLNAPSHFVMMQETLHEMRLFKSDVEITLMQRAADISSKAHCRAMTYTRPGITEHRVETELLSEFYSHGARHTAYPSIVASGENACIMHYVDNDAVLQDGHLLLIDAGCEIDQYASDITRTFPINGNFSGPQQELYDVVLEAQLAAIDAVRPGNPFTAPHETAQRILADGLQQLGILTKEIEDPVKAAQPFLVHRCSHYLGLDVHDVGAMVTDGKPRTLEPGMVLTVEPGVYVPNEAEGKGVDPKWCGTGIRIEDDVVVTDEGSHVLTSGVPKTRDQIEELMRG